MKHVINILLLGMVLLGIAMMTDTPWGLGVALAPFAVWGARFLFFIHKSLWAAVVFWGGYRLLPVASCFSGWSPVWNDMVSPICSVSL